MHDLFKYNDYLSENQDKVSDTIEKLNAILTSTDIEELLLKLTDRLKAENYPTITPDRIIQDLVEDIWLVYMHELGFTYEERILVRVVVPMLQDIQSVIAQRGK